MAKGRIVNCTPRNLWRRLGRLIRPMPAGGPGKDPGLFHAHRRVPKNLRRYLRRAAEEE